MKIKQVIEAAAKNKSFLSKLPALFRMFKVTLQGKYRPGIKSLVIFILLLVYIISPIDLIPMFILDDITVALFGMSKLLSETNKFIEWENSKNTISID